MISRISTQSTARMSTRKVRRSQHTKAPLRTPEQARQWLRDNGISVAAFARQNGFSRDTVYDLVIGRTKGNIGQAHRAAIALGMKRTPEIPAVSRKNPQGR